MKVESQEFNEGPNDDVKVFQLMLVRSEWSGTKTQYTTVDADLDKIEIFALHVGFEPATSEFLGACLDSGAQLTVIGSKQTDAYIRPVGESAAFSNLADGNI